MTRPPSRPRPGPLFLARFALMVGVMGGSALYASERYTIGYDDQTHRCLDERLFLIDTWAQPTAADLARGDLVAVVMAERQRPEGARWPAGQIMIKRVLAAAPGETMHVTEEGVSFEAPDGESWSWGTALEAAEKIGGVPDDYVRDIALAEGELFLMGDRPLSYDSRYYGALPEEQVRGAVLWAL